LGFANPITFSVASSPPSKNNISVIPWLKKLASGSLWFHQTYQTWLENAPKKLLGCQKKISSNSMVDFPACWMKPEGYIFVWFPVKKRFTTQKGCQNLWSPNAEMLKKVSHKHPYGFPRTPGLVLEN